VTVSGTQTFELTVEQLIRRACQLAGLTEASMSPDGDDYTLARDLLGMETQALQAEGVLLSSMTRSTLAIVGGTGEYALPAGTLDVFIGPDGLVGTFLATGGTYETPVRQLTRHEYMAGVPVKTATAAAPTSVYVERQATVRLQFWPVPSVAGTFKYQAERLIYDGDPGTATLDLTRRWQKAICYGVAWQVAMAKSAPLDRVRALKETAEAEKATARAREAEGGPGQFYVPRWY
jgi:hypothetical protein